MNVYLPKGVCAKKITFDINEDTINKVVFESGCPGSLQGVSKLIEGMNIHEAIEKLKGIRCGFKNTSCPDQLSKALEKYIHNK